MKKIVLVMFSTLGFVNIDGMEFKHSEDFFKSVNGHNRLIKWTNKASTSTPIALNFDGRKRFIESVRSANEVNNFEVTSRILENSQSIEKKFNLKNKKNKNTKMYYSSTYLFLSDGNAKPYIYDSSNAKNGILDDFIFVNRSHPPLYSNYINYFAKNVLRILKKENAELEMEESNRNNRKANQYVRNTSLEIASMILTTERARDEYSVLISYIEFYKLKHTNKEHQQKMLKNMFDKDDPVLKFPKAPGGAKLIRETSWEYLYNEFIDMLPYSPYYSKLQQLPEFIRDMMKDEFYESKLEKLKAISKNQLPPKSKFKKLVDASNEFYNAKMRKIINQWKNLKRQTEVISEPEID